MFFNKAYTCAGLVYFAIFENCLLVILERGELGEGRFSLKLGSRLV